MQKTVNFNSSEWPLISNCFITLVVPLEIPSLEVMYQNVFNTQRKREGGRKGERERGRGRETESMPVGATHWKVNILILLKTLLGVKWINRWLTYVNKRLKTMLEFPQANQVRVTLTRLSENYAEYNPAALILKCLYIFPLFLPDT